MIGFKILRVWVCFSQRFRVRVQSGLSDTTLTGSGFEVSGLRVFGFEKSDKMLTFLGEKLEVTINMT